MTLFRLYERHGMECSDADIHYPKFCFYCDYYNEIHTVKGWSIKNHNKFYNREKSMKAKRNFPGFEWVSTFLGIFLYSATCFGATIHVPGDYPTIQDAINPAIK